MISRLPGGIILLLFYFYQLFPFANLHIENLISQKVLQLGASILVS